MSEPTHLDLHRQIGVLQAKVENLEEEAKIIGADVKTLLAAEERRKGERGVIAALATAGGAVGTLIVSKLFPKLLG